ncbi:LysE family translocator [Solihabitans fulvus]|uniref:LysE family translocator n=1 Tax=Solihabitans fulvus TaxID=1892852 RepID=A0A5B2X6A7_9PSEU|nr:LysE family translocator [Solihabitans fulvus]KAA2258763.1 LysE family translocator [Solihabitans fulvus]
MHVAWASFLVALVVLMLVPGPDFVLITRNAALGMRWGVLTAAGVICGLLVHATAATLGLSALVAAVPTALFVVKVIGAAYLGYLGLATLRAARGGGAQPALTERTARAVFLRGVLGDLLNPKVMLIFLTLVPQAMDPQAAPLPQAALLSGVVVLTFAAFWALVVPLARQLAALLARPRARRVFERCCGAALLGMAASIIAV